MSPAPADTLLYTVSDTALYQDPPVGAIREEYVGPGIALWVILAICAVLFVFKEMGKAKRE